MKNRNGLDDMRRLEKFSIRWDEVRSRNNENSRNALCWIENGFCSATTTPSPPYASLKKYFEFYIVAIASMMLESMMERPYKNFFDKNPLHPQR
jgi:hypothetical protein